MEVGSFISPSTIWTLLAFFSVVWIGLGYFWSRRVKNTDDFLFAGRGVGFALSSTTIVATWVSCNTVMSAPEITYHLGIWGMVGYALGAFGIILFIPIGIRIKALMPSGFGAGDFLRIRFGKAVWLSYLLVLVLFTLGFLVTQAKGGGILLSALAGIDYHLGMVVVVATCIAYTFLGGMKAVVGTDFAQSMIIIFLLLVTVISAYSLQSPGEIYDLVLARKPLTLDLLRLDGLVFAWNNWIFGTAEVLVGALWWQRLFSMRSKVVKKALPLAAFICMAITILTGLIAFVAIANNYRIPQVNMIFPIVASTMLGKTGAILVFFIIFASLTSTLAGLLASSASFLAKDFYYGMINHNASDAEMRKVAKRVILALGGLAIALSWNKDLSMYRVLLLTGPLIAALIFPMTMGIFWKQASSQGAFWAILGGASVGVWSYFQIGPYSPSIFSVTVSGVVMSLFTIFKPDNFVWGKFRAIEKEATTMKTKNQLKGEANGRSSPSFNC